MDNSTNKVLQREQHKRNLVLASNAGDDSKLTKQECLDLMAAAISVRDWNALREIVKKDYELASIPMELQKLLHQIDGSGLIVSALKNNEIREFGEVPADMIVDLDDENIGELNNDMSFDFMDEDNTLDDSKG